MKRYMALIVGAGLSMLAFGLSSALFGAASHDMAATLGLSLDEVSLLNVAFMAMQLIGFMIAPLLLRSVGNRRTLYAALSMVFLASLMLITQHHVGWHLAAWMLNGLGVSLLLISVNLIVLSACSYRAMTLMTGFTLTLSTLLPMGLYPWLLADILEHAPWQTLIAIQAWCVAAAGIWAWLYPPQDHPLPSVAKSSPWVYLLTGLGCSGIVFLLMRGSHYNWFDFPDFGRWALIALACLLFAGTIVWHRKQPDGTGTQHVVSHIKANVFLYNAFLAGFAVMASGALLNGFLGQVMHFNATNSGWVQAPAFLTMLIGMAISLLACNQQKVPADAMTPLGVLMILISVYLCSTLPSNASAETLLLPIGLRGFGVGLLNVSVTILVFAYFKPEQRPEGIALFYFIRTLGGLIGSAVFSRIIQVKSAQSMAEASRMLPTESAALQQFEQHISQALMTQGVIPNPALAASQLSQLMKTEVSTQALNNAFIGFLIAIFVLTPVLLIGKKLAAKKAH
ncbi:MFS transporter [Photobacterium aphoticum]|uniref:MFS transporter n=2 Tax=Photobacterium aphoticum TaxID=754436 RepID=A0A0J1GHS1_9GAMM|nr:MFS transporter [Photobacterium aphoticum]KLU99120.1 hypothetical protein ABT58_19095 [Photobacterium aphoticum]PSU59091.1 MFS transporter [Photobacterium aphoticum]GHA45481.1 MFS transporter [Photobacterium aphoticum]